MSDEASKVGGLALSVQSLSVCFHSRQSGELIWALKDCSLSAEAGSTVGITGVSGGGKSTLSRALLGLVDSRPGIVGGHVGTRPTANHLGFVPSESSDSHDEFARTRKSREWKHWRRNFELDTDRLRKSGAFLMLQEPRDTLNPYVPIKKMLSSNISDHSSRLSVKDALELVELPGYVADRHASELSTGMCQRVHLAIALCSGIRMLIADEPLIRLDMRFRSRVADLLARVQKERRFTLIILSHDLQLLHRLTEQMYVLNNGSIVESGATASVWEAPKHAYSQRLISTFRKTLEPAPTDGHQSDQTAASLVNIRKNFDDVKAVDDVTLDIKLGECVGLLGESGCGKTTLARLMIGLDTAEEGSIELSLSDVTSFRPGSATPDAWRRMRASLQLVYQDADSALDPEATASEAVEEAYLIHYPKLKRFERKHLVRELFDRLALPTKLLSTQCCYLSGGEARRTIIAQSMAALGWGLEIPEAGPRLLIADEPTTGLDAENCALLIQFLEDAAREMKLTLLIISHDLPILRRLCRRLNVMYAGRIVESGGPEVIRSSRPHVRHPFTEQLICATGVVPLEDTAHSPEGDGCAFYSECTHPMRNKVKCSNVPPLEGLNSHQVACWFEPGPVS